MMIGLPKVSALKCLRSAGRCQGSWLSRPITRFSARAAIMQRGREFFIAARIPSAWRSLKPCLRTGSVRLTILALTHHAVTPLLLGQVERDMCQAQGIAQTLMRLRGQVGHADAQRDHAGGIRVSMRQA